MSISSLNNLRKIPKLHEMSRYDSPRSTDSIYKQWQRQNEIIAGYNSLIDTVNQLSRELQSFRLNTSVDFEFFPFKIYTVTDQFRPSYDIAQYTSSINWRTVRVRGGLVLTQTVSTSSFVYGTDTMQNYAYYNYFPTSSVGYYDYQVPSNTSNYWFWIEQLTASLNGTPYQLRQAADPRVSSSLNPNPWIDFPTVDTITSGSSGSFTRIPIGYCDTLTSGSQNTMYIRQFLTTDVLTSGGSGSVSSGSASPYKRYYSSTATYNFGDMVILPTTTAAGFYICAATGSIVGIPPTFPTPETLGSGSNYWDPIAGGNIPYFVCGGITSYVNTFQQ